MTRRSRSVELRPCDIYFTQDTVAMTFQNGKELNQTCEDIAKEIVTVQSFPKLNVLDKDGKYYSVDNRRLYIFRVLEKLGFITTINVKHIPNHPREVTTQNGGCHVRLRSQKDNNEKWKKVVTYLHCKFKEQQRKATIPGWWDDDKKCHVDVKRPKTYYGESFDKHNLGSDKYSSYNPKWGKNTRPKQHSKKIPPESSYPGNSKTSSFSSQNTPPVEKQHIATENIYRQNLLRRVLKAESASDSTPFHYGNYSNSTKNKPAQEKQYVTSDDPYRQNLLWRVLKTEQEANFSHYANESGTTWQHDSSTESRSTQVQVQNFEKYLEEAILQKNFSRQESSWVDPKLDDHQDNFSKTSHYAIPNLDWKNVFRIFFNGVQVWWKTPG